MKTVAFNTKNFILNSTNLICKNCKHSYVNEKTGIRRCRAHRRYCGCDKLVSDKEKCDKFEKKERLS